MIEEQFITYIVKQLVDEPDAVSLERVVDDKGVLLKLTVAASDLGRVIGRHGATAQSLRNLLRALGTKNDAHYTLKIIDVDRPEAMADNASDIREPADEPVAAPETPAEVQPVDNSTPEPVENDNDRAKKMREELAQLDDLDI